MASRYHTPFKERKLTSPGRGPAAGRKGEPGAEAANAKLPMTTTAWPSAGPARGGSGFNKTTKMRVVKTSARSIGVDA